MAGRPLILAGQTIPHSHGLAGHSDADAVAHAVTDAVLGATASGDIGSLFPDTDDAWRGADSMRLLGLALEVIARRGFRVRQVDITVVLERPRLGPYRDAMTAALAGVLGIAPTEIGLKAKTNEGMGFIGRGEGIAVMAVATVEG